MIGLFILIMAVFIAVIKVVGHMAENAYSEEDYIPLGMREKKTK